MPILLSHFLYSKYYMQVRVCCHLLIIPMPTVLSSFLFTICCHMFSQKRRAWQGSNLQSSDSQSDAFPLRHRPSYSIIFFSLFFLFFFFYHNYYFLFFISVGSYQVGYTRSHPNTEVKMLRACSVPLCSHRWERKVIYLFIFFII